MMKFYSTGDKNYSASFEEAVRQGLAPDGGLFMPETISPLPSDFWEEFSAKSFKEISYEVAAHFLNGAVPEDELRKIIEHTISFDTPLVKIQNNIFSLELFHGPTLAFKDFGARFLSGVLGYFASRKKENVTILVATSGDTGSAVAHGFFDLPGIEVVVLYPSGKVSELQEKQFTTLGGNVTALEVNGTFDDCQRLVKQCFADDQVRTKRVLTSANSINIARLIPQMFYYFRAFQQLDHPIKNPVAISVPSGNFGNLMAGLMAKRMGLPVEKFIAATNLNDVVPEFLVNKKFVSRPSVSTISNAMDVGNPSNFARIMALYDQDWSAITRDIVGYSFADGETKNAIDEVFKKFRYTLDPHGAVGYLGLRKYLKDNPSAVGIFLETAHPGKFKEAVEQSTHSLVQMPERLLAFMHKEKKSIPMMNDFMSLKSYLIG